MFGYIRINKPDLTFREYEHYKAYYCGICKYLKNNCSEISRFTINYDITFLVLLLTSIYTPRADISYEGCIANPFKKKKIMINEITEYAAAMNVILAYYKTEDDVRDEGDMKSKISRLALKSSFKKLSSKYPEKTKLIDDKMRELSELEKEDNPGIDRLSNVFGEIMAEIFRWKDDEYTQRVMDVGFNLGKYIYLIDAYEDLDEDVLKDRFNPFKVDLMKAEYNKKELKEKVDRLAAMSLGMAASSIEALELKVNKSIIDNIMYSGVYLRYKAILYKEELKWDT